MRIFGPGGTLAASPAPRVIRGITPRARVRLGINGINAARRSPAPTTRLSPCEDAASRPDALSLSFLQVLLSGQAAEYETVLVDSGFQILPDTAVAPSGDYIFVLSSSKVSTAACLPFRAGKSRGESAILTTPADSLISCCGTRATPNLFPPREITFRPGEFQVSPPRSPGRSAPKTVYRWEPPRNNNISDRELGELLRVRKDALKITRLKRGEENKN